MPSPAVLLRSSARRTSQRQHSFSKGYRNMRFSILANLVAAAAVAEAYVASPSTGNVEARTPKCCAALAAKLGSKVVYAGSDGYDDSISSYWTQQHQLLSPSCILLATGASDVSTALKVLVPGDCKFAVRSGGHGSAPSVSNIEGGVTIDLTRLNFVTPSKGNRLVSIGPGQTWHGVYSALYPLGVSVAGVRAGGVGVAGSTLGGGVGYFIPGAGFSADQVVEYEVVLASGRIVTASGGQNGDLFLALKGGGSNLGIVTKFVFKTLPLGDVWAGDVMHSVDKLDAEVQAYHDFIADPNYDDKAQTLLSFYFAPADGTSLLNMHFYAEAVEDPEPFKEFLAIEDPLLDTTGVSTLPDVSEAAGSASPDGFQQRTFSTAFRNDVQTLKDVFAVWNASTTSVASVEGISWSLTLAAISRSVQDATDAQGRNIMGLDVPKEGIVLAMLSATFADASGWDTVDAAATDLLEDIIAATKANGKFHPWIDLNHAAPKQDVFRSYGEKNYRHLEWAAGKFDPKGVFQTLLTGPFKL